MMRIWVVAMSAFCVGALSLPASLALEPAPPIGVKPKAVAAKPKNCKKCDEPAATKAGKLKASAVFSFDQSGGFAAMHRTFESAIKDLSKADADKLSDLIVSSGLMNTTRGIKDLNGGAADVFVYNFKVINGKKAYSATYDDTTLPKSYRPLLDFLKNKAVDAGRT